MRIHVMPYALFVESHAVMIHSPTKAAICIVVKNVHCRRMTLNL